jgi:hypothetical protein
MLHRDLAFDQTNRRDVRPFITQSRAGRPGKLMQNAWPAEAGQEKACS